MAKHSNHKDKDHKLHAADAQVEETPVAAVAAEEDEEPAEDEEEPAAAVSAAPVAAAPAAAKPAPAPTPQTPAPAAVAAAPAHHAHEKLVVVHPRVSRNSFRCAGRYWTTTAGKEMRVPPGVAEHMKVIGLL